MIFNVCAIRQCKVYYGWLPTQPVAQYFVIIVTFLFQNFLHFVLSGRQSVNKWLTDNNISVQSVQEMLTRIKEAK